MKRLVSRLRHLEVENLERIGRGFHNMSPKSDEYRTDADRVWSRLCHQQLKVVAPHASSHFLRGWKIFGMSKNKVPDFASLSSRLKQLTDWSIFRTEVQYSNFDFWIRTSARRKITVSKHLHPMSHIDFTPFPDLFHDGFGHLPYMAIPEYARVIELFADIYTRLKTKREKKRLELLLWNTIEFSFIRERGKIKVFGTGLISSQGELAHALKRSTPKASFDFEKACRTPKSDHGFHDRYFVLGSLGQLQARLEQWLRAIQSR